MLKSWKLLTLSFFMIAGAALILYLFGKEDVTNLSETITGNTVDIPIEEEPSAETLLQSILTAPIDFDGQMAKLRTEGFENNYFIARIDKVDNKNRALTLEMKFPVGGGFETEEKIASVNCPVDSTAVLGPDNTEVLVEKEDIFKWVKKGDLLVSYCLDSLCSSIGRECVVVDLTRGEFE